MADTSFPRNRIRISLLENVHPSAAEALTERGYSVEVIPVALEGDELRQVVAASHVLGVRSRTKVREEHLSHAGRLTTRRASGSRSSTRRMPRPAAWPSSRSVP